MQGPVSYLIFILRSAILKRVEATHSAIPMETSLDIIGRPGKYDNLFESPERKGLFQFIRNFSGASIFHCKPYHISEFLSYFDWGGGGRGHDTHRGRDTIPSSTPLFAFSRFPRQAVHCSTYILC